MARTRVSTRAAEEAEHKHLSAKDRRAYVGGAIQRARANTERRRAGLTKPRIPLLREMTLAGRWRRFERRRDVKRLRGLAREDSATLRAAPSSFPFWGLRPGVVTPAHRTALVEGRRGKKQAAQKRETAITAHLGGLIRRYVHLEPPRSKRGR